jgi:alginate O-acetyltransferase complex protein AlgJ
MPRLHPIWMRALAAVFVLAIALPGGGMLWGVDAHIVTAADGEKRELASAPLLAWNWELLRAWPDGATHYIEDRFAYRSRLVRWQAALRLRMHSSPTPNVIVGKDGWFFYADNGAVEDYTVARPFSPEQLEIWRTTLQHTHDWLRARDIAYLFVIAPDKHAVYPEFMPEGLTRLHDESRASQLVRYLHDHSDVPVLDLTPALLAGKRDERLYQRTDTHWNDRGAFVAYDAIMSALSLQLPLAPLPRTAFRDSTVPGPGMDLAAMMGLTGALHEDDLRLSPSNPAEWRVLEPTTGARHFMDPRVVTEHARTTLPRAVVFRDSFGAALVPFLADHFSRAVHLWQYNMDPEVVLQERPAVVIQQWVGRRLSTLAPYDPFAPAAKTSTELQGHSR